jgi:formylglycine-generating enzyme required for sulfatase activity
MSTRTLPILLLFLATAANAAPEARRYPWGDAWNPAQANTAEAGPRDTRPVGETAGDRGPYGVWDMAGNAAEWVRDAWDPAFYIRSPSRNPVNDTDTRRGVARGGAWCLTEWDARTTSRQILLPSVMRRYMGFRCAETVPTP